MPPVDHRVRQVVQTNAALLIDTFGAVSTGPAKLAARILLCQEQIGYSCGSVVPAAEQVRECLQMAQPWVP